MLSKINHVSIHALMHLLYRMSNILTKRKKPNIIRIYDTITRNSKIFLFQDLICGGDLFSYLVKDDYLKAIPEREAILLFSNNESTTFSTKTKIVHRDLKLDNILFELPIPGSKSIYVILELQNILGTTTEPTHVWGL